MKTKEITAYTFESLDESVQQKVLDKLRYINVEDSFWYEGIIDGWKEKLAAIGFINADISFSGFGSQGDGCSFKADIDLDKLLVNEFDPLLKEDTEFFFDEYRGYSHFRHWTVKQNRYLSCDAMDKLCNEFVEWINDYKSNLEREIYKELENQSDYYTSDECVKESVINNEYFFLSDGTMV